MSKYNEEFKQAVVNAYLTGEAGEELFLNIHNYIFIYENLGISWSK